MNYHEPQDVFKHFGLVWVQDNMKNMHYSIDTLGSGSRSELVSLPIPKLAVSDSQ